MQSFILFLKGFIVGLGKIIPGVSGSVLAISLGIYEKCLEKIVKFIHQPKESFQYLFPIFLGIALSIILFSKIILFFYTYHKMSTTSLFLGLLIGTIPSLLKEKIHLKKFNYIYILIITSILIILTSKVSLNEFIITSNKSYIWVFILGMIDAISMIIPGLSGTAIFLMLGSYTFILNLFSNPFNDIVSLIAFSLGFIIALLILINLLNYLFKKHPKITWNIILIFIIYSISLLFMQIPWTFHFFSIIDACFFFLVGLLTTLLVPNE